MPSRVAARRDPEPRAQEHHFLDDHPEVRDTAGVVFGLTGHMLAAVGGIALVGIGALLSLTFVGLGPGVAMIALGGLLLGRSMIWQSRAERSGRTSRH